MYSEIKNNRQVLINRLTDSERILLKDIYDLSKVSTISLKELDDETGDFSGVIMTITPEEPKELAIEGTIATSLEIFQKEKFIYTFPVDNDVTILIDNDDDNMMVTSKDNQLSILASEPLQDVIKYEISKEGYKHIHGEITVNAIVRDKAKVTFNIIPEGIYNVRVCDENCTHYFSNNGVYELPIGTYHVFVSSINHRYEKQEFEVTEEDIININKEVEIDLVDLNDTCRVVFKQSNTNTYGRVKMVVIDNATGKKLLDSSIDPSFGIEVYHLPVGEYTYSVESEKDMWTMEPTQLVISKDDIKTEKTISVVLTETNPTPDEPGKTAAVILDFTESRDAVDAGATAIIKNESGVEQKPSSSNVPKTIVYYHLPVGHYTIEKVIPEGFEEINERVVPTSFSIIEDNVNSDSQTAFVFIIKPTQNTDGELGENQHYAHLVVESNTPGEVTADEIANGVEIQIMNSDSVVSYWEKAFSINKDATSESNSVTYNFVVDNSTRYMIKSIVTDNNLSVSGVPSAINFGKSEYSNESNPYHVSKQNS